MWPPLQTVARWDLGIFIRSELFNARLMHHSFRAAPSSAIPINVMSVLAPNLLPPPDGEGHGISVSLLRNNFCHAMLTLLANACGMLTRT
jgi:hypothetical protein